VAAAHAASPLEHGYLIRGHGIYTWGKDLDEAYRHIEIWEFLLECLGRQIAMS
jgi:methylthioribulose-1-phosphate dehydratase